MIERTHDMDLVRSILLSCFDWVADDLTPKDFKPVDVPAMIYLLAVTDRPVGVFILHPHNFVTYETHVAFLREGYGLAEEAAKAHLRWMRKNTPCRKVMAYIPVVNQLAYRLAKSVGFVDEGFSPKSFLKSGELIDRHILGISV